MGLPGKLGTDLFIEGTGRTAQGEKQKEQQKGTDPDFDVFGLGYGRSHHRAVHPGRRRRVYGVKLTFCLTGKVAAAIP